MLNSLQYLFLSNITLFYSVFIVLKLFVIKRFFINLGFNFTKNTDEV
jgi:hypothetical protein